MAVSAGARVLLLLRLLAHVAAATRRPPPSGGSRAMPFLTCDVPRHLGLIAGARGALLVNGEIFLRRGAGLEAGAVLEVPPLDACTTTKSALKTEDSLLDGVRLPQAGPLEAGRGRTRRSDDVLPGKPPIRVPVDSSKMTPGLGGSEAELRRPPAAHWPAPAGNLPVYWFGQNAKAFDTDEYLSNMTSRFDLAI